ncbi:hypothetical protein Dgeo_2956 (plasmid) [Deinococcus geothermalis DSM 11300]|uniref:Centromere protein J C-terminal domain-containing protein n=1 Tax=Deinococcus geothermalis (strain DSM 11300 / CIP 105573 / AG-3a) TaxID=319795 RepID=A8ZR90_DEIGD|nr:MULTISPECIES: hypothetical protein [Deinococcus]ABW34999.1 hypothetical protein Dgeo_2956 [Deinococcus geothermalis DSM 11300]TDE84989.1 hypothetical protein E0686_14195 [Deinococcus sp. S9]
MTNLLDRLRKRKPDVSPDLPPGARMPEDQPLSFPDADPFAAPGKGSEGPSRSTYDPSQRELLEPQLSAMGLHLPDDPDSPEFRELINRVRAENPALSAAVQGMVRDNTIDENNQIMLAAEKNARRHGAPAEKLRQIFMTTNANGEPVFNKNAAMVAAGAAGLLLFAGIALYNPSSGTTAKKPETSATSGKTVTNPDGSTITTYADGSTLTKKPDGSQVVEKPNGEILTQTPDGVVTTTFPDGHTMVKAADGTSVETLADGSKVTRDAAGNVVSTTPPVNATSPTIPAAAGTDPHGASSPQTQATAPLDSGYQSTPPAATDPYATSSVPADVASQDSGVSYAPFPSEAETASGISASGGATSGTSTDPYAGTPYEAGIYNPTEAEIAAGYTPSKAPARTTPVSGEQGPILLTPAATPSAAETAGGFTAPSRSGLTLSAPAASTTPVPDNQPQAAAPVRITVYRRGQRQQEQATGDEGAAPSSNTGAQGSENSGAPAGASGGQSGTVAFRKIPVIATQILRASSASSTPNGSTGGNAATSTSASAASSAAAPAASGGGSGAVMIAFKKGSATVGMTRITRQDANTLPGVPTAAPPTPTTPDAPLAPSSDTGSAPSSMLAFVAGNGTTPGGSAAVNDTAATSNTPPAPTVASPYRLGQRVMATLETGVYVAQGGGTLPVYASTQDGTLWRGTVSLDRTKRVLIIFDRAVLHDGTEVEVQAAAYNLDGTPGLKAQYRDIAPTLANGLIRSAVSGVRDYVDAKLQATSTTTSAGGAVTVERQVPTIWESVAGSATGIFQLPTTQNTFVTVAQIPVGAQFALVYGPTKTELGADQ